MGHRAAAHRAAWTMVRYSRLVLLADTKAEAFDTGDADALTFVSRALVESSRPALTLDENKSIGRERRPRDGQPADQGRRANRGRYLPAGTNHRRDEPREQQREDD